MKVPSLALALCLGVASIASADTTFGTGPLLYSGSVLTTTICFIHNDGSKPVQITSVGIPGYSRAVGTATADSDNCTSEPLPADRSCNFSGSLGVYGGGTAQVKGSTKKLRGECTVYNNATGLGVMVVPMR